MVPCQGGLYELYNPPSVLVYDSSDSGLDKRCSWSDFLLFFFFFFSMRCSSDCFRVLLVCVLT